MNDFDKLKKDLDEALKSGEISKEEYDQAIKMLDGIKALDSKKRKGLIFFIKAICIFISLVASFGFFVGHIEYVNILYLFCYIGIVFVILMLINCLKIFRVLDKMAYFNKSIILTTLASLIPALALSIITMMFYKNLYFVMFDSRLYVFLIMIIGNVVGFLLSHCIIKKL